VHGVKFVKVNPITAATKRQKPPHAQGRFLGPEDDAYIRLVDHMRGGLIFKACEEPVLQPLLRELAVVEAYNFEVTDYQGRNPLHRVALSKPVNPMLITLLAKACPNLMPARDENGHTPLHTLVFSVKDLDLKDHDRKPYMDMFKDLEAIWSNFSVSDDPRDSKDRTPWYYVDNSEEQRWIKQARSQRSPFAGAKQEEADNFDGRIQDPDKAKRDVCHELRAGLFQFASSCGTGDCFALLFPSIFRLIYEAPSNSSCHIENLFEEIMLPDSQVSRQTCRLIYLPANNVSGTNHEPVVRDPAWRTFQLTT
jgi:hypothetical protein